MHKAIKILEGARIDRVHKIHWLKEDCQRQYVPDGQKRIKRMEDEITEINEAIEKLKKK